MTLVVGLALVSLGFVFGLFCTCNMIDKCREKFLKNTGHTTISNRLYKCVEVKEG